jgi:hypothetical protein
VHERDLDEDDAIMSKEDLLDLLKNLDRSESECASARSLISLLETRNADLEISNFNMCEEKEALTERVKLLETFLSGIEGSESRGSFEWQNYQWIGSFQSAVARNINYVTFCTAAADICRSSRPVDLKEVNLLQLIASFLPRITSDMVYSAPDPVLLETSAGARIDESRRYQAMNAALCSLVDSLNLRLDFVEKKKNPDGWC